MTIPTKAPLPTPRTDALVMPEGEGVDLQSIPVYIEHLLHHARTLERELAEAIESRNGWLDKASEYHAKYNAAASRPPLSALGLKTVAWRWKEFDAMGGRTRYHEDCPQGEGSKTCEALVLRSDIDALLGASPGVSGTPPEEGGPSDGRV